MPDQGERYPYIDPGVFASGTIRSESNPKLCIDNKDESTRNPLNLYKCHRNLTNPGKTQSFILTWHRQIRTSSKILEHCLDTYKTSLWRCHFEFGHQLWFYNLVSFCNQSRNFLKLSFLDIASARQSARQLPFGENCEEISRDEKMLRSRCKPEVALGFHQQIRTRSVGDVRREASSFVKFSVSKFKIRK